MERTVAGKMYIKCGDHCSDLWQDVVHQFSSEDPLTNLGQLGLEAQVSLHLNLLHHMGSHFDNTGATRPEGLAFSRCFGNGAGLPLRKEKEPVLEMVQHHAAGQQHGRGVGDVLASNALARVACGLKRGKGRW